MPVGVYIRKLKDPRERFWKKVSKTPTCWNWVGSKQPSGHGEFFIDGRRIRAHWFLLKRWPDVSKDEMACHHCDNPSCVRPSHVYVGTRIDNMQDMVRRKRWGRINPEIRSNAAFTWSQVDKIRSEVKGVTFTSWCELARKYKNKSPNNIKSVFLNRTWKTRPI